MQGTQQVDGLPCTPFLWFLVHNGNWSLGLLLPHLQQRRSGSCSMVAEVNFGFKTDIGQAEFEYLVCRSVSHNLRYIFFIKFCTLCALPSLYCMVFNLLLSLQSI